MAEELYRASGDAMGLGLALMGRRQWREAAAEFGRISGPRRTDAVRRRAACCREARDWAGLEAALRELAQAPDLDPVERRGVKAERAWARDAAAMAERASLGTLLEAETLLCDNPLLCRRAGDDLELLETPMAHAGVGVPMRYAGGPFRVEWEMQFLRAEWSCDAYIGMEGDHRLGISIRYGGETAAPTVRTALLWSVTPVRARDVWLPADSFRPEIGEWYRASIEYVPALALARLRIRGAGAEWSAELILLESLPRGMYRVGKLSHAYGSSPFESLMVYRLRNLRVFAAAPSTAFDRAEPRTAREHLAAANTEFVLGRLDRAEHGYAKVLGRVGPQEAETAVHALFFRGILRARQGRRDEGLADLRAAWERSREDADKLLQLSFPGMTAEDRALFRR